MFVNVLEVFMIDYALLTFTSLITLMNPLGIVPTFLSLTDGESNTTRNKVALKCSVTVFIVIVLFAGIGDFIFDFFGVTVNGLRIVGGIVMIRMGFDLLSGHSAKMKKENLDEEPDDISITPLGFPIVAGAGTLTNAILLGSQAIDYRQGLIFVGVTFLCSLITYITFANSTRITDVMGRNGRSIMNRVMGLILMMIAVEMVFAGIKPVFIEIGREIMK